MLCSMKVRLIYAAIGISAGLMAGTVFAWSYGNWLATGLAYFSSVCATYLYYTHTAYNKRWMFDWSERKLNWVVIISESPVYSSPLHPPNPTLLQTPSSVCWRWQG
jgi:hypothetical protein